MGMAWVDMAVMEDGPGDILPPNIASGSGPHPDKAQERVGIAAPVRRVSRASLEAGPLLQPLSRKGGQLGPGRGAGTH